MLAAREEEWEPKGWPQYHWEDSDVMDGLDCLRLIYEGKEVEGEIVEYKEPKNPIYKEITFSLDGKKYRFMVEEVQ